MNEIQRGLLAYLSGEQSFVAFNEWLSELAWNPSGRSYADVGLLRELELRVAEFTGGFITEDELKNVIREIAGFTPRVVEILWAMESAPVQQTQPRPRTGSSQTRQRVAF